MGDYMSPKKSVTMNVLSLFDGISAGQLALHRAGINDFNYYASEIDEAAIKVTQHHFPNTTQLGDVTNLDCSTLPKIDLLFGGSPCQSFSNFGDGTGFDGKSGLFNQFIRVLVTTKPTYFLLENVKMKAEWKDKITELLGVEPIEINSSLVSGQSRTRLYWTNIPNVTTPENKNILLKDILLDLPFRPIPKFLYGNYGDKPRLKNCNWVGSPKSGCLTTNSSHAQNYLLNEDKTLCRLYHPNEYEMLQTFPVDYTAMVTNTERFKQLGNSWTVDVIAHIFKSLTNV